MFKLIRLKSMQMLNFCDEAASGQVTVSSTVPSVFHAVPGQALLSSPAYVPQGCIYLITIQKNRNIMKNSNNLKQLFL